MWCGWGGVLWARCPRRAPCLRCRGCGRGQHQRPLPGLAHSSTPHLLPTRTQVLDEEHPATLAAVIVLADCLNSQGKRSEAEPLYQRALAMRIQVGSASLGRAPCLLGSAAIMMRGWLGWLLALLVQNVHTQLQGPGMHGACTSPSAWAVCRLL